VCIWNQQGNPDYRTALKMMKHFCMNEEDLVILVKWQMCFVLVVNHHSSLLLSSNQAPTSYNHQVVEVMFFFHVFNLNLIYSDILCWLWTRTLRHLLLAQGSNDILISQHPQEFFTWSKEWRTMDEHPPPWIQILAMPVKVGNVSFFSGFLLARHFHFVLFWPYFPDKSLSITKTQDVRIGKAIHCYPVRM
jgi:hypothetical protein